VIVLAHPARSTYPCRVPALPSKRGPLLRFVALVALVTGFAALTLLSGPDKEALAAVVHRSPVAGPLVAVLGSAILVTVLVPRTLLALVGGVLFGAVGGAGYVLVGVTLGACVAFGVGRLLGRDFVAAKLRGRMALIEAAVARRGAIAVVISRLIPLVPFGLSNYSFGTTAVSFRSFVGGTLLGAAPATLAYASLGSFTMHGNALGATLSGAAVVTLGIGGSIGTFLVWRRRPRKTVASAAA